MDKEHMNKVMEGGESQNGHQALYDHLVYLHGGDFRFYKL
ncbi:uncharacterized protein METZ01_LOCUS508005 [marine metagenome]|uniref:Uncharacterized protein n=1 Tax=marine metagenome TaxID=408172 RepID=A0A383EEJ5_9ZZZZ